MAAERREVKNDPEVFWRIQHNLQLLRDYLDLPSETPPMRILEMAREKLGLRPIYKETVELAWQVVLRNEKFIYYLFSEGRYFSRLREAASIDHKDLIQVGRLGLFQAALHYRPSEDTAFATYAAYWVLQNLQLTLYKARFVLNVSCHAGSPSWQRSVSQETAQAAREAMEAAVVRLDDPVYPDGDGAGERTYEEVIPATFEDPLEAIARREATQLIRKILSDLSTREELILRLRSQGQSLEEIGSRLGLSRERVRQIEKKAIRRLRARLTRNKKLREALRDCLL